MKVLKPLLITFLGLLIFSDISFANSKSVGTITRFSGEVKILTRPKAKPSGKGPWVKFEELYYKVKDAKVGFKLKNSYVVQTYSNGKAMVVFANGDHINVGSGTSYQLSWDESGKSKTTALKLLYGNVRGVVSPKGPRKQMKVTTKTAVAGVRGTDFAVNHLGTKTEVHVLRGKVAVSHKKKNAKPVEVAAGFAGELDSKDLEKEKKSKKTNQNVAVAPAPTPILKKITKEKLIKIQKDSTVEKKPIETASLAEAEKITKELALLEEKAKKSVIEDIKTYNPEEGKRVEEAAKNGNLEINEINTTVVSKLFKEAPKEDTSKEFSEEHFEGMDDDVYEKYFKDNI
ncbi:MAG: FecR domain-containing protein [Bdellovibrionota bacterium]|nr:FecR domain-containing protein [Bdellovibrionota bacterium]